MFGTLQGRLLITAAVDIVAAGILAARGITYGLDLSGGMYLALEVQDSTGTMTADVKRQHTEQVIQILRTRLDRTQSNQRREYGRPGRQSKRRHVSAHGQHQ